jgi:hypothetical protein
MIAATHNPFVDKFCKMLDDDFYPTVLHEAATLNEELTILGSFSPVDSIEWYNSNISFVFIKASKRVASDFPGSKGLIMETLASIRSKNRYALPVFIFKENEKISKTFIGRLKCGYLTYNDDFVYDLCVGSKKLINSITGKTGNVKHDLLNQENAQHFSELDLNLASDYMLSIMQDDIQNRAVTSDSVVLLQLRFNDMILMKLKNTTSAVFRELSIRKSVAKSYEIFYLLTKFIDDSSKNCFEVLLDKLENNIRAKNVELHVFKSELQIIREIISIKSNYTFPIHKSYALCALVKKYKEDAAIIFHLFNRVNLRLEQKLKSTYLKQANK